MIVVSFGSPSAISYAVVDIVRRLLDQCVESHAVLQVVDLAGFDAQWRLVEGTGAVLVASDCPRADLVSRFAGAGQPILVCCDRFDDVVRYNMRARGMAFAPALRFTTQVLSALDALSRAPGAMRITHDRDHDPLRSFVAAVASFLGLELGEARFEAAMAAIAGGAGRDAVSLREHVAGRPHARDDAGPAPTPAEAALLRDVGRCYAPLVAGEPLDGAVWPPELLLDWDRPGRSLDGAVALLGPARFVICGPYLHLPAGSWRMTVGFATRDCRSDNRIEADVFDGRALAAISTTLPAAGQFAFDLDFTVADPLRPLELRLRLVTGAIEGSFRLLPLRVARLRASAGEAAAPAREAA